MCRFCTSKLEKNNRLEKMGKLDKIGEKKKIEQIKKKINKMGLENWTKLKKKKIMSN